MPQLLLEILSEEIPARMQAKAEADLVKALMDGLTGAGLIPEGIKGFSGPRRLVAVVEGLPVKSADVVEDVIGPKEGAPDAAIQGFLKKAGLTDINQAHVHDVPKKGKVYVAHVRKPGRQTADVIAALVPQIIRGFHWPKSMRWGSGDLRWVRPISRILCTFDGEVVPFEIEGIKSSNWTEGHRVMGRGPFQVRRFDDYENVLKNKGRVILDREERKETIIQGIKDACFPLGLEAVPDAGLLDEVVGLAEWPVVIMGDMDPTFLDLPPEVIRLSMRTHQKYFAVSHPGSGLAPKFLVVANLTAADDGKRIAKGNSRVLSARLNDARFFWNNDRKTNLEDRFEKLGNIVFHEKLGTVKQKAERVAGLASILAPEVGADPDLTHEAALLAKCDLVSDMVGEFPELEGIMGRYYARANAGLYVSSPGPAGYSGGLTKQTPVDGWKWDQAESIILADAIRDHYKPKGPGDTIPSSSVGVAVALADKLDTLVGFWSIDERPTGSKDPFALRRAALGVIRIILDVGARISLRQAIDESYVQLIAGEEVPAFDLNVETFYDTPHFDGSELIEICESGPWLLFFRLDPAYAQARASIAKVKQGQEPTESTTSAAEVLQLIGRKFNRLNDALQPLTPEVASKFDPQWIEQQQSERASAAFAEAEYVLDGLSSDLLAFFADRLKVHLREQGARHDLIDAVFALGEDDLVLIVKRVEALGEFLATEDGKNLLAGYKRAANILAIEEKKDGKSYSGQGKAMAGDPAEVGALVSALNKAAPDASAALEKEDFAGAMRALSKLRGPVDAFFDKVTVNADKADVRENRLNILSQIRDALNRVADFSKIEG